MLNTEQITSFQALYKRHFGYELSQQEALEKGLQLMRLVEILYKPITEYGKQK